MIPGPFFLYTQRIKTSKKKLVLLREKIRREYPDASVYSCDIPGTGPLVVAERPNDGSNTPDDSIIVGEIFEEILG